MWVLTIKLSPDWNGLVKIKKKLLYTQHLRRNEKDKILNDKSTQGHSDKAWQEKHRVQGPSEAPQGRGKERSGCLWHISCTSYSRQTQWETCFPCTPRTVNFGIFSSTFQTLIGIQILGILLKYRLWFRRPRVGPESTFHPSSQEMPKLLVHRPSRS